jgi:methyl-accepting chemotaxis protein
LVVSVVLGFVIVLIGAVLGFNTSRSIDRLTGKAEKIEEGNLDVDISSGRIDNIGRLYDGFANMRDALRQQIEEAEAARKEAEVSRAEAMEMNNYLQEKAEEYSEIMQACARGDLTRRMEPEGENEAMDQIAADFNEMITELEMTTGQLKTFADEVEEGGQSLQQSAETVRDASEQVADSVQKISDDAYDQKERLQRISERMDEVATTLEELADDHPDLEFDEALSNIRDVASDIEQAVELGEQTMSESENVAGAAEEQAAELNEVSARAEELTRYAQYLGDGLGNFETEEEHEFVFQTGASSPDPSSAGEGDDS